MKLPSWKSSSPASVPQDLANKLGALRMATGRADRVVSACVCAVHDKPFTVVYERTDPAKPFTIAGIYKPGEEGGSEGAGGSTGATRPRTLPVEDVDCAGWQCPHCGSDMQVNCSHCHTVVCGGKTRSYPGTKEIFECRASCGARAALVLATTFSGVDPAQPARPARTQPQHTALPSPASDALRLGAPKAPRLK